MWYFVFVDDSWDIWAHGKEKLDEFLKNLNSIWPTLNFIPAFENENREIVFLELKIKIDEEGLLHYEHYKKPTSNYKYLHFESHTPLNTKMNIIRTETSRIIRNCSDIKDIYKHINEMKNGFLSSGYPEALVSSTILPIIQNSEKGITIPKNKNKKEDPEFTLRIPYINESFTRVTKSNLKRLGLKNIRVVVKSGKKLKQYFHKNKDIPCHCYICETMGIPCKTRNFIYHATCLPCKNNSKDSTYIGASARRAKDRMSEYESGIRLTQQAERTTLGKHKLESHPNAPNDVKICYEFKIIDNILILESFIV